MQMTSQYATKVSKQFGTFQFRRCLPYCRFKRVQKEEMPRQTQSLEQGEKNYSEERVQKGFQDGCIAKTFLKATLIRKSTH